MSQVDKVSLLIDMFSISIVIWDKLLFVDLGVLSNMTLSFLCRLKPLVPYIYIDKYNLI